MGQGLYKPLVFLPPNPATYNIRGNISLLKNGKDEIPFCILHAPSSPAEMNARWCVLYSHGNAEDLGQLEPLLERFTETFKVSAVGYDYGGYGQASGDSSEERCFSDAVAVYHHVCDDLGFDPNKVILYGRSLGSGPTCHLVQHLEKKKLPYAGVFLQSPIESCVRVVSPTLSYCCRDMFHNYHKLPKSTKPVTIIHGTRDEVVPFDHGKKLSELCKGATFVPIEGAGHNDIEHRYWKTLETAFQGLLERCQQK